MHDTYNIGTYMLIVTLLGNITGALQITATSRSASSSEGDCTGGYNTCSGLFSTRSRMSSWSLLILVGVDDGEEHRVPGVNAGHLHFSVQQSVHNSS